MPEKAVADSPGWIWKGGRRRCGDAAVRVPDTKRNRRRRESRRDFVDWGYRKRIVTRWHEVKETEFLTLPEFARQYGLRAETVERWEKALAEKG